MMTTKLAAALVAAQKAFGPALKTKTNPHLRAKYADLSACIEAVVDALHANGLALIQHTHESESGVIVETVFLHESGEAYSAGRLHVPCVKSDPQGYGSALTYARRYSLMAACGIAPEDDDGQSAAKKPAKPEGKAFDLEAANKEVQAVNDMAALETAWRKHGALATGAGDKQGYQSLIALVNDRKATIKGGGNA